MSAKVDSWETILEAVHNPGLWTPKKNAAERDSARVKLWGTIKRLGFTDSAARGITNRWVQKVFPNEKTPKVKNGRPKKTDPRLNGGNSRPTQSDDAFIADVVDYVKVSLGTIGDMDLSKQSDQGCWAQLLESGGIDVDLRSVILDLDRDRLTPCLDIIEDYITKRYNEIKAGSINPTCDGGLDVPGPGVVQPPDGQQSNPFSSPTPGPSSRQIHGHVSGQSSSQTRLFPGRHPIPDAVERSRQRFAAARGFQPEDDGIYFQPNTGYDASQPRQRSGPSASRVGTGQADQGQMTEASGASSRMAQGSDGCNDDIDSPAQPQSRVYGPNYADTDHHANDGGGIQTAGPSAFQASSVGTSLGPTSSQPSSEPRFAAQPPRLTSDNTGLWRHILANNSDYGRVPMASSSMTPSGISHHASSSICREATRLETETRPRTRTRDPKRPRFWAGQ
ncbi:hypothetical protein CONLIGDRAFT_717790 [Coniochaeta ligniaria NRRL 30616]|uniref:Uncharacterized protein n=1 Tax=Coniochaeta ligniaria NRRL 30616 TaxID=1408157 RepID=A0A1J7J8P5_9PEZI|nr:hypothetical protein CONLIGDRAFT_717790 [Coniochaeta ligniaria NRRL 30616]